MGATLATTLPDAHVTGPAAGLHVLLHLPTTTDTPATLRAATVTGLRLTPLTTYQASPTPTTALVLGYGNISDTDVPAAIALLREALR